MGLEVRKSQVAAAIIAALGSASLVSTPRDATAAGKYVAGDFHNHTTCSDGSTSMQKLVKKATDKVDTPWGLDWFVQAGHGGNGNRNCTLTEDATLGEPAYPYTGNGPTTTWANSIGAAAVKGNTASATATSTTPLSSQSSPSMWRWQSLQEFQYPIIEYLSAHKNVPLFLGLESVVAGHEHTSMSVITGQIPLTVGTRPLPTTPGYTALGNANALAMWSYCFDRGDTDNSRGGVQNWDCSVPGSANGADPSWNDTAKKLVPVNSPSPAPADVGTKGHNKTVEALKWMRQYHGTKSYYVPAHLERAGPFNPGGNNGFNVEHLRNFNNAAPMVSFGMETQPGHHASDHRGEYQPRRNAFGSVRVDSVGGTTYGGTGIYGAKVGGVWDALLGEGRNWFFFASSDWHNRGSFGSDDRRSTQDFYPGEYQRNYTLVRSDPNVKLSPDAIVDGLRTGNTFVASGQLIDRLAFIVCVESPAPFGRRLAAVEQLALNAALLNTDVNFRGCATMGEKLRVPRGAEVVVGIAVRDPDGTNYSPYTFDNPSLAQVGIAQPLNAPVLDHIDLIGGLVTGYKSPGAADYAGEWPRNWLDLQNPSNTPPMSQVPPAAKNTTASVLRSFDAGQWNVYSFDRQFKTMVYRIRNVQSSQYVRLRGTNLPPSVPWETDADGNPLPDLWTNAGSVNAVNVVAGQPPEFPEGHFLKIPCRTTGRNVPSNDVPYSGTTIDGCPNHLPEKNGVKYLAYDVAAWADLWFYSNPVFIEVVGSTSVAGIPVAGN